VPKQLAIVSIDGTYLAEIVRPQLTTVTQAFYEMGTLGMQTLLDQTQPVRSRFTPIKIEIRQST
jgi:Transcriptional regulators